MGVVLRLLARAVVTAFGGTLLFSCGGSPHPQVPTLGLASGIFSQNSQGFGQVRRAVIFGYFATAS